MYQLPELYCDFFQIGTTEGKGCSESFQRFSVSPGDCLLGDRAYATTNGIHYLHQQQAYCLVRIKGHSSILYCDSKRQFSLLSSIKSFQVSGMVKEQKVYFYEVLKNEFVPGRLCYIRKSEQAIHTTIRRMKR